METSRGVDAMVLSVEPGTSATSTSGRRAAGTDEREMLLPFASTQTDRRESRVRGWGRRSVAGVLCAASTAMILGVAALTSSSSAGAGAASVVARPSLGLQPDARGVPPPESMFLRKARKAFGAALMRASYHQTKPEGEVDTAEEADALADKEAMADIVDEEFEEMDSREADFPKEADPASSAPAPRKRRVAFLSRSQRESSRLRKQARKDAREERREHAEEERREKAKEERQAKRKERSTDADHADDEDAERIEAAPSKESEDAAQKYFKSINGGYFAVTPGKDDDDDVATSKFDLHNSPGAIPGLVDHLQANGAQVGQMRVVTYANSAYWPVAKLFIESAERVSPELKSALTIMVTDRATLKECVATGSMCFLDTDMNDVLGDRMNEDGSIQAGQEDMNGDLGKALRIVWTWRKVHVVYTMVQAGYGCLFLDASTVLLRDPRLLVKDKLDSGALLVTLSDFGGALEQKAINTGLIAARPNEYIGKLLEDWMALEPTATDTEQASLTWNIAPNARADGVVITTLSQDVAPSYLTFDVTRHLRAAEGGSANGYLVHAAYCGSISGKVAFLSRVAQLAVDPSKVLPVTEEESKGCDVFDRRKFFTCGLAPWDGVCE